MPKGTKHQGYYEKYGMFWEELLHPIHVEIFFIKSGGTFKKKDGTVVGLGMFHHFKAFQEYLWPEKKWHRWNELELKCYLEHRIIGELGPASSGKTNSAATNTLADYYIYPDCTTVLVSSTEREMLEMRVFGEMKKFHRMAKARFDWIPGHLIESKQRIITDSRDESIDGRDFRNGVCGVPCKRGGSYIGLGSFAGIKNKRMRMVADELHLMPKVFVDAISNMNKNPNFKCVGIGNPKDQTDALGVFTEPSAEIGGWDGGIDQSGGTKTWPTRWAKGICIQLPGSDSPNLDGKLGIDLINQEQIDADIKFYGKDSLQFSMMDEGRMPRGEGSRRVITRQMCLKFGAMEQPVWKDETRTRIGCLDAAYGAVGGDRTVFGEIQFGPGVDGRPILALINTMLVPVSVQNPEIPEDQIAMFVMDQCKTRNIPPENFFFDSTGRGSLVSAFARLWSPAVVGVEFGGKPSERMVTDEIRISCRDYYSKFVSELWFSVRFIVLANQFRGLSEDVMMEGCMREWKLVGANRTEVEPKEMTKLKVGRSPDLMDCLVAGVEGARQRGFVIAPKKSPQSTTLTNDFKQRIESRLARLRQSWELTYS